MKTSLSRASLTLTLAATTLLSGCVAAIPFLLPGALVVGPQLKERGVTVKLDEDSVSTAKTNNVGQGVAKLAVMSHTTNPIPQSAGVAVYLTEALLQKTGVINVVSPTQVAKQLATLNINANFNGKTKLDVLDDFQIICKAKGADLYVQPIYEQSSGQGSVDGVQAMLSLGFMTIRKDKLAVRLFNCQTNTLTDVTGIVEVDMGSKTPPIAEIDKIVANAIGKLVGQLLGILPADSPSDKNK